MSQNVPKITHKTSCDFQCLMSNAKEGKKKKKKNLAQKNLHLGKS